MKFYFSPGACSLATDIMLHEAGLKFEGVKVDLASHKYAGGDYFKVNPKGSVPCLSLDNGQVLTEGAVLMQYIADQKPEKGLMPKAGTMERYRAMEWLNFVGTEIHKGFGPLMSSSATAEMKTHARNMVAKKFDMCEMALKGSQFLTGTSFTAPDAYLFTMLTWAPKCGFEMSKWPNLSAFYERCKSRPAVSATMKEEGLS